MREVCFVFGFFIVLFGGIAFADWASKPKPIKVPIDYTRCGEYMVPPPPTKGG